MASTEPFGPQRRPVQVHHGSLSRAAAGALLLFGWLFLAWALVSSARA